MNRLGFALAAALACNPLAARAQDKLNACVVMADGSRGNASAWTDELMQGGPWPNNDEANRVYASVRAITSLDDRAGCDAIIRIRLIDNFWKDRATADALSGVSGQVLYQGPPDGWLISHNWNYVEDYMAKVLKPGGSGYLAIAGEKDAQCSSAAPPDTPRCREIAGRQREQRAAQQRWSSQQLARSEAAVQEKIPAWLALKQRPPLPEGARKFRVLAEDALREKRFEDAARYYEQGLAVEPLWPEAQYNLAVLQGELRQYASASVHMRLYLAMSPKAKDAQDAQDRIIIWDEKASRDPAPVAAAAPVAASAPPPPSASNPFHAGDRVSCNWKAYGKYYNGTVTRTSGDSVFISYDDGDTEDSPADRCRRL